MTAAKYIKKLKRLSIFIKTPVPPGITGVFHWQSFIYFVCLRLPDIY
jgi:hypothetical protein